jgi:hypothetical protein
MFWFNTIIHKKMLIKLTCDLEDKIGTFLDLVQQWRNFLLLGLSINIDWKPWLE